MPKVKEVRYDVTFNTTTPWDKESSQFNKVNNFVSSKGFCTIKWSLEAGQKSSIDESLKTLKLEGAMKPPAAEVDDGLLGSEGSSAIMTLKNAGPGFEAFTDSFMSITKSLQPLMRSLMGPGETETTPPILHVTGEPEDEDDRPPLTDSMCMDYQKVFTSHRLMVIYFFGPGQGSMDMEPFFVQDANPCILTTEPGMLLVLRPDMMTHRHFSNRETTCVSSFITQESKDQPIMTPTVNILQQFAAERMISLKDGAEDGLIVPKEWMDKMNRSQLMGTQVAARSIACHYPGSWNAKEWWYSTTVGNDYLIEVPYLRWDVTQSWDPDPNSYKWWKTCSKHMSYMEGVELFDNKMFGLSPAETKSMDPQQRHILEVSYEALNDAGFTKKTLSRQLIGVFLGCACQMEWGMIPKTADDGGSGTTGGSASINSNRISFCLGMQGPSYTLDLNGAASLVGVTQAYMSQRYQTDSYKPCHTALGGGMYLAYTSANYVISCAQGVMSNKGRSLTFDATANGWAKGEGLGVVVCQKLGDVVDGKTIVDSDKPYLGTIAGAVIGNVGHSAGFGAPSGPIEQDLIQNCVRQAQVTTSDIDAVEACGDGRLLYDAVESMSLSNALRLTDNQPLTMCAVKTCMGMQHEVSGMSQFMRSLFCLKHGIFAPSNHLIELNPHIDAWQESSDLERPFLFATETLAVRNASNFIGMTGRAIGGSIAHVIVYGEVDKAARPSAAPVFTPPRVAYWPGGGGKLEDEAKPQDTYYIVGSWSNFTTPVAMQKEGKDLYSSVVTIGVNGFEQFQFCLDGDMERTLHPEKTGASSNSSVQGPAPEEETKGLHWVIGEIPHVEGGSQPSLSGGRGASASEKYKVTLRIAGKWRTVDWECCESSKPGTPEDDGQYYITASWNSWSCDHEMRKVSANEYATEVVLSSSLGRFQVLRNKDWSQMFIPGASATDPAVGPCTAPFASSFNIEGKSGDVYEIRLKRSYANAAFTTQVSWKNVGTKALADLDEPAWPRYCLVGAGSTVKFEMEPLSVNSYAITLQLTTGPVPFQILGEGDFRRAFYPSVNSATSKVPHKILGPCPAPDVRSCWKVMRDLDDKSEEGGWYTVELVVSPLDRTPKSVSWTRIA